MIILSQYQAVLINAQTNHMEKFYQVKEKYVDHVMKILDNMSMNKARNVSVKMDKYSMKEDV